MQEIDFHSNSITTEGMYNLMVCLKTNNKVRSLDISRNQIASDLKMFRMMQKFLNCNKVLETLNLSFCNINDKARAMVGKGLRGNRYL